MTLLYIEARIESRGPSGYTRDDLPVLYELKVSCKNVKQKFKF